MAGAGGGISPLNEVYPVSLKSSVRKFHILPSLLIACGVGSRTCQVASFRGVLRSGLRIQTSFQTWKLLKDYVRSQCMSMISIQMHFVSCRSVHFLISSNEIYFTFVSYCFNFEKPLESVDVVNKIIEKKGLFCIYIPFGYCWNDFSWHVLLNCEILKL